MKDKFVSTLSKKLTPYSLPENWKWFYWEDIMSNYQQGLIRSNRQLGSGNVEYLKMGDLDGKGGVDLNNLALTEASIKEIEEFKLKEGDFLLNVRNSQELVGKTCVVKNIDNRVILFNHMLVRIDNGSSDMNYFINAFFNIPSSKKLLNRIKQGTTTVIALYQRDINKLPIPLPNNKLFKAIVSVYKNVDAKIELNNKINRELEAMAKTLYDYWFVQFDFPDKNGKPYKSSGGKMVYNEDLKREIPEGWEVGTFGDVLDVLESGDRPKGGIKKIKNGIPSIGAENILSIGKYNYGQEKLIPKEYFEKMTNGVIKSGDVLMYKDGASLGRVSMFKNDFPYKHCAINSHAFILRTNNKISQNFIYFWLDQDYIKEIIKRLGMKAAQPGVNQVNVKSLPILIPEKKIIQLFDKTITPSIDLIFENAKQNQELTALRDWLLPMLMNGQVTSASSATVVKEAEEKLSMAAEPQAEYKKK